MKARLERRDHPALVVTAVSNRDLTGAVMVPAAMLTALQAAQHALDQAEAAVLRHVHESGQASALPDNVRDWAWEGPTAESRLYTPETT